MTVLDASVLVDLLLQVPSATAIESRVLRSPTLHAPHLIDVEIAHVLRWRAVLGEVSDEHGRALLDALAEFPLQRFPHSPLLPRIWELRHNFTAYDAAYVGLAETLNTSLLTRDARLASAAASLVSVELV